MYDVEGRDQTGSVQTQCSLGADSGKPSQFTFRLCQNLFLRGTSSSIDFIINEHSLFQMFTYDRGDAIDCLLGRAPLCFLALQARRKHRRILRLLAAGWKN